MKKIIVTVVMMVLILLSGCAKTGFDKSKIQRYDDFLEWCAATNQLQRNNSMRMNNSEDDLFVDNCVMVKSTQEITFDTSEVIAAVLYEADSYEYYIQYESVEAAKEAVETLEGKLSVLYACRDSVVSLDDF